MILDVFSHILCVTRVACGTFLFNGTNTLLNSAKTLPRHTVFHCPVNPHSLMNLSVFSWFKRMAVPVLLSLVVLSSVAQSIVCTIEGTTTDTETKNLYLVESGADIRVKEEVSLFVSSTLSLFDSSSLCLFDSSTLRLLVSPSLRLFVSSSLRLLVF